MGWYIAQGDTGQLLETERPLTVADSMTDERLVFEGGVHELVSDLLEATDLLGRIAQALGPDVECRWAAGEDGLDLAAEVRRLLAATSGSGNRRHRH